MDLRGWDERYRLQGRGSDAPTPLLASTADRLLPGTALDLACGTGQNAIWLASRGWKVTAVDGSPTAIEFVRQQASREHLLIDARVADLEANEYTIAPSSWDLINVCYYLQRDIIESAKQGVVPGGMLLMIVHLTEAGELPTKHRLAPGELKGYFDGWEILHSYEGRPNDPAHRRLVAEIVARRPIDRSDGNQPVQRQIS